MNLRGSTTVFLIFSLFIITQAKRFIDSEEYEEFKEYKEFEEFKKWKKDKKSNSQLIQDDESTSLERNEQNLLRGDFEKDRNHDNNSAEKSNEKQKWKNKKWKENHKNKEFNKKKYYEGKGDYERTKKNYEKRIDYQKNKHFDKISQDFEKITPVKKNSNDPPPINEAALMARYIVNQANWTSVATISSRKDIKSFPSANVISFSDGIIGNGSGIPYMYLTPLDFTAQDIVKDNRATLMMTLAQGHYCNTKNYDPMDPRCARVILTGRIKLVKINSTEIAIAEKAVFSRHPWLEKMPADHHFFFAKLKIASIAMLDTFGGPKFVPVKDYLHPPTPNITAELSRFQLKDSNDISSQNFDSNVVNPNVILV